MLSKPLKLISCVQIKSLSTSAGTGQPFSSSEKIAAALLPALAAQGSSQGPFQFHVPCRVSNPSNFMNQEAASLWRNFSLLEKENCSWCRDRYLFFTCLRKSARPFPVVCFLLHSTLGSPILCFLKSTAVHTPGGAKLLKGQEKLHEHFYHTVFTRSEGRLKPLVPSHCSSLDLHRMGESTVLIKIMRIVTIEVYCQFYQQY